MRPCCGTPSHMYLVFSKLSPHIKLNHNPDFLPEQPLSIVNYPENLDSSSNAKKLEQALQIMITMGDLMRFMSGIMEQVATKGRFFKRIAPSATSYLTDTLYWGCFYAR